MQLPTPGRPRCLADLRSVEEETSKLLKTKHRLSLERRLMTQEACQKNSRSFVVFRLDSSHDPTKRIGPHGHRFDLCFLPRDLFPPSQN